MNESGITVGIDFGTSNSSISLFRGNHPVLIPNSEGKTVTPSVVSFAGPDRVLVGVEAKERSILNPDTTVSSVKRLIGEPEVFTFFEKKYTPPEIAAIILSQLKRDAEKYLNKPVTRAVITVPAYFDDRQRQGVKKAGELAGLMVLRTVNEPTAVSLAYGLGKELLETVVVVDMGGGTIDISVLELGDRIFEVKATGGNNHLGGDDLDKKLMEHVLWTVKSDSGLDLSKDKMSHQKLKNEVERVKISLSESETTRVHLPFISADESGPKHVDLEISRATFEKLIYQELKEVNRLIRQTLSEASLSPKEIDHVLLVGGSTQVPAVRKQVEAALNRSLDRLVEPLECVSQGAAIQASLLTGNKPGAVLVDVTSLSLGVESDNGDFIRIIPKNTIIPVSDQRVFTTVTDHQSTVEVHILQGEFQTASENVSLGRFLLEGIRTAPRGVPRIEVKFDIDVNGMVQVTAYDLDTGREQNIRINRPGRIKSTKSESSIIS